MVQLMRFDASTTRLTDREIEQSADAFRDKLGLPFDKVFNIVELLEFSVPKIIAGFILKTEPTDVLLKIEAYAAYDPPQIVVREDVCARARQDHPRSRFTLAHELGHLVLHSGDVFPRIDMEGQRSISIPAKESTEWQAHRFGASFLMPRKLVEQFQNAAELARFCKVSASAAKIRLIDVERQLERERVMRGFEELLAILESKE
jgi:hypothetical protein